MYAKSFIALDGNRRLTGAIIAQIYPYDHYCSTTRNGSPTARGLNTHGKT